MVSNSSHKMPYIGCKVSVVSKLGIRYEGVLYSVDCTQASILLVKVRSFGTEDRPSSRQVPARPDTVYDSITFRAVDIRDLVVCDDQPSESLMKIEEQSLSQATTVSQAGSMSYFPPAKPNNNRRSRDYQGVKEQQPRNYSRPSAPTMRQQRLMFDNDYDFEEANTEFLKSLSQIGASLDKITLHGDSVEKVVKEEPVMEKCYDKNKSFFDHISSEIRDKENGKSFRTHWRKESLINRETFGQSTVNRNPLTRRTFGGAREYHGSNVRRGMGRPGMTVRPREWVSSPFRYTINRHGNAF
ncbi:scd6-like sm domain-containing protein [Ditylenchus destructor]|uniref:Scd6-like sm domain-containing protein n=1 Tax=Ditylenchus destructor TaxID=166010 RepID=A0AAD4NCU6_9BILA|nr:scd6-like sm domain-containing protein [Ditylenchus destructor]